MSILTRLFLTILLFALACVPSFAQEVSIEEAAKLLPDRIGDFRARGKADEGEFGLLVSNAHDFGITSQARRFYLAPSGQISEVYLVKTETDSGAYSLLTHFAGQTPSGMKLGEVGTAGIVSENKGVLFYKGATLVRLGGTPTSLDLELARLLASKLDAGEGGVPPLALHLPEWEKVQGQANYIVSIPALKSIVGGQPVLDVVSFEGGAEAVTARYGDARLVIIEYTTPQYAQDNDARILERIAQLRAEGQPVPTSYRRVGNYAVFVFDAPDEAAAAGLIEQVKYEKDVRWLGDNPHVYEQAEKFYKMTMGGVVITTLKATGLAILICLGVGGIFGGAIFLRRRARSSARELYTDAGGMLRLNIEDVNRAAGDPAKLIGGGGKR